MTHRIKRGERADYARTDSLQTPESLLQDDVSKTPSPRGGRRDSLGIYYGIAREYNFLTRKEEQELVKSFQQSGDIKARDKLIMSHMPLVIKIANRYKHHNVDLEDLISESTFGLIRAAEKFDLSKDFRFCTYAAWWIRSYIVQYMLSNWSIVRPASLSAQKKLFFHFNDKKKDIQKTEEQTFLTPEQTEKMAKDYRVTSAAIQNMEQQLSAKQVSLNASLPSNGDSSFRWEEVLSEGEEDGMETSIEKKDFQKWQNKILQKILKTMSPREKSIITDRWLKEEKKTLQKLSEDYNVSRERIRQIEARAFEKIQTYFEKEKISKEDILSFA